MRVLKTDGTFAEFEKEKIVRTCLRAGLSEGDSRQIADTVASRVYEGMPTRKILTMVLSLIRRKTPHKAGVYDLKRAISKLQPMPDFEKFIAKLFEHHGWKMTWNRQIMGQFVEHQIDAIAEKDNRKYLVEVKHHRDYGVFTGLKPSLQTWARLEDINNAGHGFTGAWLVCNTKFSQHALDYAEGKGLRLTGWYYPHGKGIERRIDCARLYPITILRGLDRRTQEIMVMKDVVTIKDLLNVSNIRGIDKQRLNSMKEEAKTIVENSSICDSNNTNL